MWSVSVGNNFQGLSRKLLRAFEAKILKNVNCIQPQLEIIDVVKIYRVVH